MVLRKAFATLFVVYLLTTLLVVIAASQWQSLTREPVPDFTAIQEPAERKQVFFNFLRPLAERQNELIELRRERLIKLADAARTDPLSERQSLQLEHLAKLYNVESTLPLNQQLNELLARVDTVPPALVLVQAAKESAWGRSRFAREGNNYFGQWCFSRGCGLVPQKRSAQDDHEVRRFTSPSASVASYMHNLNTHRAYRQFRTLRADIRQKTAYAPTGYQLASALTRYSELGETYVRDIRKMILANDLEPDQFKR